jgi:hypothetical protein
MKNLLARVRVVLTAAPTYLTAAATAIALAREEIAATFPTAAEPIARWAVPVAAALLCAARIIRRVTPVLPEERGLLPAGGSPGDAL